MPNINLYNFTKKSNSTAIPDATTATTVTFTYKSECSTHSPILLFEWEGKPDFTYAQIGSIYYFITDIVYVRQKLWQLELKEDCLGTFKEQIKNSSQLIGRTSTDCDPQLIDNEYITKMSPTYYQADAEIEYNFAGTYIVGIADGHGISYYGMDGSKFSELTQQLFAVSQDTLWDSIAEIGKTLNRTFLNVLDYIRSCQWVPFTISGATQKTITMGYWSTGITASVLSPLWTWSPLTFNGKDIKPPALTTGNFFWTNASPFRKMLLHMPFVGNIELSPLEFSTNVNVKMVVDIFGKITYTVTGNSGKYYILSGDCSVPIALSASTISPQGLIASVGTAIGATGAFLASGGGIAAVASAVAGVAGGVSAVNSAISEPTTIGVQGSFSGPAYDSKVTLFTTQYNIIDDISSKIGYLLMKQKTLSANGYYLILKPVVNFGDYYENEEIASMMEGGFYIE